MRITVKIGIITAFAWIGIKMIFHYFSTIDTIEDIVPIALLNILGLLLAIAIGLFIQKMRDTEGTNALLDIKNAMTAGIPYVIIVSVFIYVYYNNINPEFYKHQIAEKNIAVQKMVNNPKQLALYKKNNPETEVMTNEQIIKRESDNENINPAKTQAILTLLALTVLSTIYSLLVTMIFRRILFKRLNQSNQPLDNSSPSAS
jgi:hypothetical protein